MRSKFVAFIAVFQTILFASHYFVFETWMWFHPATTNNARGISALAWTTVALSLNFTAASLLAFRFRNAAVRVFYTLSAAWLGIFTFVFLAAVVCWPVYCAARVIGLHPNPRILADSIFALAALVGLYGIANAALPRVRRIRVRLPNLPEAWRGRVAALVSDVHLGHVRHLAFARRVADMISHFKPDAVFIAGDMYDGTAADFARLAQPFGAIAAKLGKYFITGNHEGFNPRAHYLDAVRGAGVRVLHNEKITLDGVQIVGVNYADSTHDEHFRSVLRGMAIDRAQPSILLSHVPHRLTVAEEEGIALQLSGHTHAGQFFPFTWITSRIWGPFTYGLKRFGRMLVYTSSGVGTWGPPLRIGTAPEIVLIEFA